MKFYKASVVVVVDIYRYFCLSVCVHPALVCPFVVSHSCLFELFVVAFVCVCCEVCVVFVNLLFTVAHSKLVMNDM